MRKLPAVVALPVACLAGACATLSAAPRRARPVVAPIVEPAEPGSLRTFRDWAVGCDNVESCTAFVVPRGRALRLVVRRDAGPDAKPRLELPFGGAAAGTRLPLAIDGRVVAVLVAPGGDARMALPLGDALRRGMIAGRSLTLGGARASLFGVRDSLSSIDLAQRRVGTVTALHRPGRRPAAAVPAAPALPTIVQPAVTAAPPRPAKRRAAAKLLGKARACRALPTVRLDAQHSLLLAPPGCGAGSYVVDERGAPAPAAFDVAPPPGVVRWDGALRRLVAGDDPCGRRRWFVWDGSAFRLAEQRDTLGCEADAVVTWRADVLIG